MQGGLERVPSMAIIDSLTKTSSTTVLHPFQDTYLN